MARRLMEYFDDEDERKQLLAVQRKRLRNITDPFDMFETEFINLYRMPQELCLILRDKVAPFMVDTTITKEIRLLVALSFLAEGSFQKKIGGHFMTCTSQSVVSRCIKEFCTIVNTHLMNKLIIFPQTSAEISDVKTQFYNKFNWPGILGCIDGTHVSMFRPAERIEHVFLNRHHYHSINVQLICDYNLKILSVNANYGGSNHDATIWRKSLVKAHLHNKYDAGELQNTWLLGDSGYPLQPWLMTPISAPSNESEEKYNITLRSARNCIERLNGVLKSRFRCLAKDRCIKYSPKMVGLIINTCATLHNFIKHHHFSDAHDLAEGVEEDEIDNGDDQAVSEGEEEDEIDNGDVQAESVVRLLTTAREVQQNIVQDYFTDI